MVDDNEIEGLRELDGFDFAETGDGDGLKSDTRGEVEAEGRADVWDNGAAGGEVDALCICTTADESAFSEFCEGCCVVAGF